MKRRIAKKIRQRLFAHSRNRISAGYKVQQLERAFQKVGDNVGTGISGVSWDNLPGYLSSRLRFKFCTVSEIRGKTLQAFVLDDFQDFEADRSQ